MDLIKTTAPELAVPSHEIEYEAYALAGLADNPGLKKEVFLSLASKVLREFGKRPYKEQIQWLEYRAEEALRRAKAVTERIEKVKEATHSVVGNANVYEGYELPDPDDQYRGPGAA